MKTQSDTILKVYNTERGANKFKNQFYANDETVEIQFVGGVYMVVAVHNW